MKLSEVPLSQLVSITAVALLHSEATDRPDLSRIANVTRVIGWRLEEDT
jgi:hypothetical protein